VYHTSNSKPILNLKNLNAAATVGASSNTAASSTTLRLPATPNNTTHKVSNYYNQIKRCKVNHLDGGSGGNQHQPHQVVKIIKNEPVFSNPMSVSGSLIAAAAATSALAAAAAATTASDGESVSNENSNSSSLSSTTSDLHNINNTDCGKPPLKLESFIRNISQINGEFNNNMNINNTNKNNNNNNGSTAVCGSKTKINVIKISSCSSLQKENNSLSCGGDFKTNLKMSLFSGVGSAMADPNGGMNSNGQSLVDKLTGKVFPKPPFSYSCLIAMSLRNSDTGNLPVSDIYEFIVENFPYYKTARDGWKNSIRHNLSLNKCFRKIENPTSGSKKGCLWALNPEKCRKLEEECKRCRQRDPVNIRLSMRRPDDINEIERGEQRIKKYATAAAAAAAQHRKIIENGVVRANDLTCVAKIATCSMNSNSLTFGLLD
jgi:hypothetical protein